jgi:hypothetical protein
LALKCGDQYSESDAMLSWWHSLVLRRVTHCHLAYTNLILFSPAWLSQLGQAEAFEES